MLTGWGIQAWRDSGGSPQSRKVEPLGPQVFILFPACCRYTHLRQRCSGPWSQGKKIVIPEDAPGAPDYARSPLGSRSVIRPHERSKDGVELRSAFGSGDRFAVVQLPFTDTPSFSMLSRVADYTHSGHSIFRSTIRPPPPTTRARNKCPCVRRWFPFDPACRLGATRGGIGTIPPIGLEMRPRFPTYDSLPEP